MSVVYIRNCGNDIYRTARVKCSNFRRFMSVYVDPGCVDNIFCSFVFVTIDNSDIIIHLVWWLILTSVIHMVLPCVLSEHVDSLFSVTHD